MISTKLFNKFINSRYIKTLTNTNKLYNNIMISTKLFNKFINSRYIKTPDPHRLYYSNKIYLKKK